jgi:hypothetical protein
VQEAPKTHKQQTDAPTSTGTRIASTHNKNKNNKSIHNHLNYDNYNNNHPTNATRTLTTPTTGACTTT